MHILCTLNSKPCNMQNDLILLNLLTFYFSVNLFIPYIYQSYYSIHLLFDYSIYLSILLFYLSINLIILSITIWLFYLSINLIILFIYQSYYISICPSIYCFFFYPAIYYLFFLFSDALVFISWGKKSIYLFIYLTVYLFIYLSIYLFNLLFNEITNLKFPPFLITGRIITYPPYLQGG